MMSWLDFWMRKDMTILYGRRDSRIRIIAMAVVRELDEFSKHIKDEFSKRIKIFIKRHFFLFHYCLLRLQHLIWYKSLSKSCLYICFLAYNFNKSSSFWNKYTVKHVEKQPSQDVMAVFFNARRHGDLVLQKGLKNKDYSHGSRQKNTRILKTH